MSPAHDMVNVARPRANQFAQVPAARIPRSQFDRSKGRKQTMEVDRLVPVYCEEVLPGDTVTMRMNAFVRVFSPLNAPIMDNIHMDVHFFYVPYRLVWTNWEKFNGAQDNPGDSTDFTIPIITTGYTVLESTVGDYMGIPVGLQTGSVDISALPFRAYRMIYNEWYRDQNLINRVTYNVSDTADSTSLVSTAPYKRAKKHDYFTSALPWPQKGDAVAIPIGTTAPIVGFGKLASSSTYGDSLVDVRETNVTANQTYVSAAEVTGTVHEQFYVEEDPNKAGYPGVYADLSSATAATINQLRQSFQVQRLLERDARGGTRYVEILASHFGVTSPDFRLQRPEFLGSGRGRINVSPVAQTSESGTTDQGYLTGVGIGELRGGFAKSFTEHGVIIGIVSARADLTYQQGLPRMFSRSTRYDFYWPALAQIGEQAILKKEIFVSNSSVDEEVFGYQERYAEYRYGLSEIAGKFHSDVAGSLDLWHLAEDFASAPALNQTFIESTTPMSRVQAVTTEPDLILDSWFDTKWARPMPLYGVPGLIDHF